MPPANASSGALDRSSALPFKGLEMVINLLMGFFCEVDGDAEISLEEDELAVAEFIPRDKIGEEARDVSLTADMIMHFKEMGQEEIMKELH